MTPYQMVFVFALWSFILSNQEYTYLNSPGSYYKFILNRELLSSIL